MANGAPDYTSQASRLGRLRALSSKPISCICLRGYNGRRSRTLTLIIKTNTSPLEKGSVCRARDADEPLLLYHSFYYEKDLGDPEPMHDRMGLEYSSVMLENLRLPNLQCSEIQISFFLILIYETRVSIRRIKK